MIDRNGVEPLHTQIKNDLVAQIQSGQLNLGDKLPSENQMVRSYGVSRVTVRAALAELTETGCLCREQGRGAFVVAYPRLDKRLNIDVLLDSGDTYFAPSYMLKGISPVLEQNQCNLLMHDTKHDSGHIVSQLNAILNRGTDGIILAPISHNYHNEGMDRIMERCKQSDVPVVVILGLIPYENCVNLNIDDAYGVEVATRYLLECGHRRLLGLFYELDREPTRRLNGFRQAVSQVPGAVGYEIVTPDWEERVLELVGQEGVTAIQCYNDRVAVEALRLLVENGYRVPQDVSLAGFDDSEIAQNSIPRLTTMSHPKDHLGRAAAEAILHMIRHPGTKLDDVTYRPGLVIRQSVRDLRET